MTRTAPIIYARELWELGYADRKAGRLNAKWSEDWTWNGRAYRDGIRAAKRDEHDERLAADRIAGNRAKFIVIDDPIKSAADEPPAAQTKAWFEAVTSAAPTTAYEIHAKEMQASVEAWRPAIAAATNIPQSKLFHVEQTLSPAAERPEATPETSKTLSASGSSRSAPRGEPDQLDLLI